MTLTTLIPQIEAQENQAVAQDPTTGMQATAAVPDPPSTSHVSPSVTQSLLDKAHAFEGRGRMDMAVQTWQQVLLTDPSNPDALGGLARAARLQGNTTLSNKYLDRLRAAHPNDPNIARVENMTAQQSQTAQLQQAAKLAEGGQYAAAMAIYRQVFGSNPPPGDWSLAYYETESATEDGRPHAIAGLTALVQKYPPEARYQIALGRILTYNPKTREEGRKYLERFPKDPQADEGVRQSLLWDSPNPAMAPQIRAYLATHHDPQLASALQAMNAQTAANAAAAAEQTAGPASRPSAAVAGRAQSAAEIAAYKALNAKHIGEGETRFKAILANDPENAKALAGMGYVRMEQGNFSGAISFLEQAKHNNSSDQNIGAALDTSRFWFVMGEGQVALNGNDLTTAEKQYRAALALRPTSPDALEGLGGTLLKAQQPAAAMPLFEKYVQVKPAEANGWRGLFLAQYQSGNAPLALATEKQIPAAAHAQLMKDPMFLRTLASAYSAVGRDGDAQRVLNSALALPFPIEAKGMKAETQLQFAGILLAANHLDQAAALYRQVLADDHGDIPAWQGLVRAEHAMGHDTEALQTVEAMPPGNYEAAMLDPGFETTVASIYQTQKKLDVAQDLLEKALAKQTTAGQKPSVAIEMQLAGIYMERGNAQLAYPIYQRVLTDDPARADAWAGLLSGLHTTGHDKEALAQVQLIAAPVRTQLETNIGYLQTMASVYGALGQSREASLFLARVEQFYAAQHTAPPADVEIQNAWLLFNGIDDTGLYRQLMSLGGRPDLTDDERRTVQTIWTNWAVRRANQAAAAGNPQRALAILNAAAHSFPDNPAVIKALANGYARAGQPSEAVLIYKAQNMSSASVADYQAAVGAALAAGDNADAERWLRFAMVSYPSDPQILILAAKFEQSRGDTTRAIGYYRRSLSLMPRPDPGAELAAELSLPAPSAPARLPSAAQAQDLSTLLAPGNSDAPGAQGQLYLPSYGNVYGQTPLAVPGTQPYYGAPGVVPPYMTNPEAQPGGGNGAPKNFVQPQAHAPRGAANLPSQPEVELAVRNAIAQVLDQSATTPQVAALPASPTPGQTAGLAADHSELAAAAPSPAVAAAPTPEQYQKQQVARLTQQASAHVPSTTAATASPDAYGSFVPYVAPPPAEDSANYYGSKPTVIAVQLGNSTPHPAPPATEVTDVIPTARYVPNARGSDPTLSSHPDIAAAQAASIRRQQSDTGVRTGQSLPVDISTAPTENAEYQGTQQITQPSNPLANQVGSISDTGNQQYPQPSAAPGSGTPAIRRRVVRRAPTPAPVSSTQAAAPDTIPLPAAPEPEPPQQPAASVPTANYPPIGAPYPLGPPPSDADLMARNLPPLRGNGNYGAQVPLAMTPRQEAESQLASLEGSYSGWLGGTGIGRYRSGTLGLDRLYDIEAPVEVSTVLGHSLRLTVIALPVFLNSGTINPSTFAGYSASTVPYLGTRPANASNPPAQQLSDGVGGELQLTTKNIGLAAGYTPYHFLVQNITGRFRWRPAGGPFTLFAERDSVKDTQLSYAGLRDPGTATPTYAGNIWGGVISTTGGVRLDVGSGGSGFYLSADAGVLKGEHVLTNRKAEGAVGAYLRVKSWPGYGSLTIGGMLFGMHYDHNELGLTYGQGGYFSPHEYFLASVPLTFNGYYKSNFHYVISGALGVQTFQQQTAPFFPLDPGLQGTVLSNLGCTLAQTAAHNCGEYPVSGNTGFNYIVNSEVSYLFGEHWYLGGFVSGNNTNNYNTVSGGFFFRYVFHKQREADGHPTGIFPIQGFRPVQIP
jgi:cellulose synthase operon protein C